MKLRIRHGSITKPLTLPNGDVSTIGQIKSLIRTELLPSFSLTSNINFNLSLDGTTSLGSDCVQLNQVGVVAGDLLKMIAVGQEDERLAITRTSAERSRSPTYAAPHSPASGTPQSPTSAPPQPSCTNGQSRAGNTSLFTSLLLQDYKPGQVLPPALNAIYSLEGVKSPFHVMCALLHSLMQESGFFPQPSNPFTSGSLHVSVVNVEYTHPDTGPLVFSLTFSHLGPFILVNGVVNDCVNTEAQLSSLQLKLADYVTSFASKPMEGKNVYKKVGQLSRTFKADISHRAVNNMRAELRLPPLHGIFSLFPELLTRIFSYLDVQSLCALAQTCRQMSDASSDDMLWRRLYIRNFSSATVSQNTTWKEMYKREHMRRQRAERERREYERDFAVPPHPFAPNPDVPVFSPYPGQPLGMLGGDHDLDPTLPYGPFATRPRRPNPFSPNRPRLPGFGNPLPGSRFDPMSPFGNFRPGRGGGMMDDDGLGGFPMQPHRRRGDPGGGFM